MLPPDPLSLKELLRLLELARLPPPARRTAAPLAAAAGDAPAEGAAPDGGAAAEAASGEAKPEAAEPEGRRRRQAEAPPAADEHRLSDDPRPYRPVDLERLRELLLHRPVTARRAAAGGPVDVQHVVQLQPNNTMADAERWASELESTIVTDATL